MGASAPWTKRLWELVQDGPVPKSYAQAKMALMVPPGRAYRFATAHNRWKSGAPAAVVAEHSESQKDRLIRAGGDTIAYQAIWTQLRAGHIEEFLDDDGIAMLRLGPKPWLGPSRPAIRHTRRSKGRPRAPYLRLMSPWTTYIRERLLSADGPILRSDLVDEAARRVPDERARQAHEVMLQYQRKSRAIMNPRRAHGTDGVHVRAGARDTVQRTLSDMVRSGRIQYVGEGASLTVIRGPNPFPDE